MHDISVNRREFLRFDYNEPIKYNVISEVKEKSFSTEIMRAITKNLSASGILFITNVGKQPNISSLLVLDLDYKTTNICREIEDSALVLGNKLIGKVVRIEDNEDGTCAVGVAFIKKADSIPAGLKI
ncbi:MAG: PilZ domain-containing protein [Candidatus Omnitrophota bacterium]